MDHTVLAAYNTMSALTRKHFQAVPPCIYTWRTPGFNLLLIYRPQVDGWLSWPCWLTYSRRFTPKITRQLHVMAQARENSPVIDRRSNQLCYRATLQGGYKTYNFALTVYSQCQCQHKVYSAPITKKHGCITMHYLVKIKATKSQLLHAVSSFKPAFTTFVHGLLNQKTTHLILTSTVF